LYPVISEKEGNELAPKITGMLVDLNVLEVNDVLEFFEDPVKLDDRISEAKEIIQQEVKWNEINEILIVHDNCWQSMKKTFISECLWMKWKI